MKKKKIPHGTHEAFSIVEVQKGISSGVDCMGNKPPYSRKLIAGLRT